jgi:hypothetical protein
VTSGRWRFPAAVTFDCYQDKEMTSEAERPALVELYVMAPVPVSGAVQATMFTASATTDPLTRWVARKNLQQALASGIGVPMLANGHHNLAWYRPIGAAAFIGEPHHGDVRQGTLGNCKLMSAMQALAARPGGRARLKKIFGPGGQDGTYLVQLRTDLSAPGGGLTYIPVDNYFPVHRDTGRPIYALYKRSAEDTFPIWPALLEKAVAVAWGGYQNLVEVTLSRITDDTIFATFGVAPYSDTTKNKLVTMGKPAFQISTFVTKPFSQGATFTAASRTHNYAVIGADKDGIILADPRSAPKASTQWSTVYEADDDDDSRVRNAGWDKDDSSDKFPIHLTWARVEHYLMRLSCYNTPPPDSEGKGEKSK